MTFSFIELQYVDDNGEKKQKVFLSPAELKSWVLINCPENLEDANKMLNTRLATK